MATSQNIQEEKKEIENFGIEVHTKNGLRYGTFEIGNIKGGFPRQAITTTNLNHLYVAKNIGIDYKTKVLEIFLRGDLNRLKEKEEYEQLKSKIGKIVEKNKDKICLLLPSAARTKTFTKEINEALVKFQIDCGFKFVKVFFKNNTKATEYLDYFKKQMTVGKYLVPVLDENLKPEVFKELYLNSLGKTPLICFLGRAISKKNLDNQRNYLFIRSRITDNIIRIVSDITKTIKNDIVKSLLYNWLGYDIASFTTRIGTYKFEKSELRIIKGFTYVPLSKNKDALCTLVQGNKLIQTVGTYEKLNRESIPCSIYSIIQLNTEYENLFEKLTSEEIKKLLEEEIKPLLVSVS